MGRLPLAGGVVMHSSSGLNVLSSEFWDGSVPELGIIGVNLINRQRINRSTLSIIGYRLGIETVLLVCHLKTKSDDRQIKLSVRTNNPLTHGLFEVRYLTACGLNRPQICG